MKLLAISGSLRASSSNTNLLRAAIALAPEGSEVDLYDGLADLPHFNPDDDHENVPPSVKRWRAALNKSLEEAAQYLASLGPDQAGATWRLTLRGNGVFAMPRAALPRSLMLNHWYHHRGQLTVYLRLLDVPLPVVYGRTADENPFA